MILADVDKYLILYTRIFFNIQPVNAFTFDLFYAALDKRIVLYGDGKSKVVAFPFAGTAIFQVFRISTILQVIPAGTGRKDSTGILSLREIMLRESKMTVIDDLDKGKLFRIIGD